jgi:biopolymer transport protein TolR
VGRRRRQPPRPISEINVTPFVDVMLVLLIIFMVTAPLLSVGVPIDLPQTVASPLATADDPVTVTVDVDGTVFVEDEMVSIEQLVSRLTAGPGGLDSRVHVRGDTAASYGAVMRVLGVINEAGLRRIALVGLPEQGN